MMGLLIFLPILLVTCFPAFLVNASESQYPSYENCSSYTCNGSLIKYPFNNCGYINVECAENQSTAIHMTLSEEFCPRGLYRVVGGISESSYTNRTIRVACHRGLSDYCIRQNAFYDDDDDGLKWKDEMFYIPDKYKSGSVLVCDKEPSYNNTLQRIECLECRFWGPFCYFIPTQLSTSPYDDICQQYSVVFPNNKSFKISAEKNLMELLLTGFEINWNINKNCPSCEASGGICLDSYYLTGCICPDGPHQYTCSGAKLLNREKWWMTKRRIITKYAAALGVVSAVFIISIIIFNYARHSRKEREQQEEQEIRGYMDPLDSAHPSIENFLQGGIPTRYTYRQIKRYSNNFSIRLGQGGFGTVFKGELKNGCMVAIKILDKSKHSQIQFLNEVATIGRIHHLHLVRLLGYCLEGSKRALIYEFMVNGSLEKYIHGDDQNVLNWKQLQSIAMGTARGIVYLHDDCRSKILHCDIKPHNVLLDANFSPKVADFGLAKLTDREESHISLTGARGTPGYVAPEVWSRSNGPVTDRSDVYSYGMLVMEMVGGRKNFDMKENNSSKFYYPEWAFKQVQMGEFRKLRRENIVDDEDEIIVKKLSMLGLWCIQYNHSSRPSMSRVIQMLEGTVDITMPPQPFPVDTQVHTSASLESSSSM